MSHSRVKIWIHGILGVKNYEKLLIPKIENRIHNLIKEQFIKLYRLDEIVNR